MAENPNLMLFIKNTPPQYSVDSLRLAIADYVEGDFCLKRRRKNQGSRKKQHAIIMLTNHRDKSHLLQTSIEFKGRTLVFQTYKTSEDLQLDTAKLLQRRVYIEGIPYNFKRSKIKNEFSKYGEIDKIFFKKIKSKSSDSSDPARSKCYITFKDIKSAHACMKVTKHLFFGREIVLYQKESIHKKKQGEEEARPSGGEKVHRDLSSNKNEDDADLENWRKGDSEYPDERPSRHLKRVRRRKSPVGAPYGLDFEHPRRFPRNVIYDARSSNYFQSEINPYRDLKDPQIDWMNQTVKSQFIIGKIVPKISESRPIGNWRLSLKTNYNHHESNLNFQK